MPGHLSLRVRLRRTAISFSVAWLVAVTLAVLIPLALPKPAHACYCGDSGSPREAMAEADAVFFGKVVTIQAPGPRFRKGQLGISSADLVTVEFRVRRVWKGPIRDTLSVQTERSEISCGFEFKEGREYIVYTWRGNRTGLCTRTAPAWLAARDFAALGFGNGPESAGAPAGNLSDTPTSGGPRCNAPARPGRNRMDLAALGLLAGAVILGARPKRRL